MEMGLWALVSQATIVVKAVMILLAVMSLTSWAIIFTKAFTLTGARRKVRRDTDEFLDADDLHGAIARMGRDQNSPAYRVAVEGVTELNRFGEMSDDTPYEALNENLDRALSRGVQGESANMSGSLPFLATCANAAPFIGLFGTVWGIMHSFHQIGQMKTAALAAVAPGISEALIATAIGLAVAIPATVAYNYFMGIIGGVDAELSSFAGVFMNRVQRELPVLMGDEEAQAPTRRQAEKRFTDR
ncbi:protein TolQ [Oceanidesulfovibrio marinus]|uniref:Protein TolQ n=1 Tax=Oceanidesulfovibrio marinus TaxID=370038 RepID=A0A6P1ZJJ5_9BACT|nr:protein TolQ [Oceanidesulfovibrio marinus]QJT10655.1 protein TolQ [Oceanidesulfovibrio marinus]TVM34117.1 protein TolQ [Oceanidesulfovibrio marinus]